MRGAGARSGPAMGQNRTMAAKDGGRPGRREVLTALPTTRPTRRSAKRAGAAPQAALDDVATAAPRAAPGQDLPARERGPGKAAGRQPAAREAQPGAGNGTAPGAPRGA